MLVHGYYSIAIDPTSLHRNHHQSPDNIVVSDVIPAGYLIRSYRTIKGRAGIQPFDRPIVTNGLGGNDTLRGALNYNNELLGGTGSDLLIGGDGNDILNGAREEEIIQGLVPSSNAINRNLGLGEIDTLVGGVNPGVGEGQSQGRDIFQLVSGGGDPLYVGDGDAGYALIRGFSIIEGDKIDVPNLYGRIDNYYLSYGVDFNSNGVVDTLIHYSVNGGATKDLVAVVEDAVVHKTDFM